MIPREPSPLSEKGRRVGGEAECGKDEGGGAVIGMQSKIHKLIKQTAAAQVLVFPVHSSRNLEALFLPRQFDPKIVQPTPLPCQFL